MAEGVHPLKAWRKANKIAQQDFALVCGINGSYLSRIEQGRKWPAPHVMQKIRRRTERAITADIILDNLDPTMFEPKPNTIASRTRALAGASLKGSKRNGGEPRRARAT